MVTTEVEGAYKTFADRLLEACRDSKRLPKPDERGFNKALGKMAGVGYKGAEKWVKGSGMPGMANASLLADKLGVRLEWLMTGRGPKKLAADSVQFSRAIAREDPVHYGVSEADLLLARSITQLPDNIKTSIKALIEAFLKETQNK